MKTLLAFLLLSAAYLRADNALTSSTSHIQVPITYKDGTTVVTTKKKPVPTQPQKP